MTIIRGLIPRSQGINPHFTRARPCPSSHHNRWSRPLPHPSTPPSMRPRPSQHLRTVVSVLSLLINFAYSPVMLAYSLSPELHGAPITPPYHPYAQPQVVPNPDDLGYDFFTGAGSSSLPMVHRPPACEPPYEECEPIPLICRVRRAYSLSVIQCGVNSPNPAPSTSTNPPSTRPR